MPVGSKLSPLFILTSYRRKCVCVCWLPVQCHANGHFHSQLNITVSVSITCVPPVSHLLLNINLRPISASRVSNSPVDERKSLSGPVSARLSPSRWLLVVALPGNETKSAPSAWQKLHCSGTDLVQQLTRAQKSHLGLTMTRKQLRDAAAGPHDDDTNTQRLEFLLSLCLAWQLHQTA